MSHVFQDREVAIAPFFAWRDRPFFIAIFGKEVSPIQIKSISARFARVHPSSRFHRSAGILFPPLELLCVDPALTFNCKSVSLPDTLDKAGFVALLQLGFEYVSQLAYARVEVLQGLARRKIWK
jgi:hypothetical protein